MGGGMGGGMGMGGGGMGGGRGGSPFIVRMRGLPFRVTENDIGEWFSSVADPLGINIRYNNQGRPTGEADVMFSSAHDAKRAMSKDRQNMQHRYVELFYDGPEEGGDSGSAGGFGGDAGGAGASGPAGGYGGGAARSFADMNRGGMMGGGGAGGFGGGQGGGFGNGFQTNMSGGFGSY